MVTTVPFRISIRLMIMSPEMPAYICVTCGVQQAESSNPPEGCAICEDERQYIGWEGQRWTTLAEMQSRFRNELTKEEPGLTSIATTPSFAIGQHALLVQTPAGNLLWDCVSLLDDETIAAVRGLGGLKAIAISHPHFYGSCMEWSQAFGGAQVFIHTGDRQWVMRPGPNLELWSGDETEPVPGLKLIRLGGHFEGSAVLYWKAGAAGRGALLAGDTIAVMMDRRAVSIMYSYPNQVPLSAATVTRIVDRVKEYPFDRLYGAFAGRVIPRGAEEAVARSISRYVRKLQEA
jgi:glyoxylase-like metal-dependent hydrolase (beta-lactamase superfamily II)